MTRRGKRTNEKKIAEDVKTNHKTFFKHERNKRSVTEWSFLQMVRTIY